MFGNPVLDFVIAEMKRLNFPLSLKPISKQHLFKEAVKDEVQWQINNIIDNALDKHEIEGECCGVRLTKDLNIRDNKKIIEAVKLILKGVEKEIEWTTEKDMEEIILEDIPTQGINRKESDKNANS